MKEQTDETQREKKKYKLNKNVNKFKDLSVQKQSTM